MEHSMIIQIYKTPADQSHYGLWRVSVNHGEWGYYAKSLGHATDISNDLVDRYQHRNPFVTIDARG